MLAGERHCLHPAGTPVVGNQQLHGARCSVDFQGGPDMLWHSSGVTSVMAGAGLDTFSSALTKISQHRAYLSGLFNF